MIESFYKWLNSGRFIYCLVPVVKCSIEEHISSEYPDALTIGEWKILNIDKSKAETFVLELGEVLYEFREGSEVPILISHSEVISLISNFNGGVDG